MSIIDNIYQSKYLKYPLSDDELRHVGQVWEFIDTFKSKYVVDYATIQEDYKDPEWMKNASVMDYRKKIIDKITKKYDPETFYLYESILEKMLWNLRWLHSIIWVNHNSTKPNMTDSEYIEYLQHYTNQKELPETLLLCTKKKYNNDNDLENIYNSVVNKNKGGDSYINKTFIIDKETKTIYIRGINDTSYYNYFNYYTASIMYNRTLYEKLMANPLESYKIHVNIIHFFYPNDYPFPNLNFCAYGLNLKEDRLEKIKKMYFSENNHDNWYSPF